MLVALDTFVLVVDRFSHTWRAAAVLMPVTSPKQLNDLSDDMAAKVDVQFYSDARDALSKAMTE